MSAAPFSIIVNSVIPDSVRIVGWVNIYNAYLGDDVFVSPFVEIGGAIIGPRTRIGSHSYICPHVEIGSDCFIAHGVMFCNDTFREPSTYDHIQEMGKQWKPLRTTIGNCVRIGSGAVILPVRIGNHAIIGAGSIVTKDVPDGETWSGCPAKSH